ncbi:MAG: hypothetical protein JSV94_05945 [Methanobacteriota archaeon]|nr:MAG: hypothetical protein JSV94_05945 [Euryarchaeota archaeon]
MTSLFFTSTASEKSLLLSGVAKTDDRTEIKKSEVTAATSVLMVHTSLIGIPTSYRIGETDKKVVGMERAIKRFISRCKSPLIENELVIAIRIRLKEKPKWANVILELEIP